MKTSTGQLGRTIAAILIWATALLVASSTGAATFNWTNAGTGTFVTAANWTNTASPFANGVPASGDVAVNNIAGSTTTIGTGDAVTVTTFQPNAGAFSMTDGTLNVANLQLLGTGGITQSGGIITATTDARVQAGGAWAVSGGTLNLPKFVLGAQAGSGNSMTVSGNAIVTQNQGTGGGVNRELWIGGNNGGSGTLLLKDNATWTSSAANASTDLIIGRAASAGQSPVGVLTVQDNASLVVQAGGAAAKVIRMADISANASGTVNLNGGNISTIGFQRILGTATINANGGKITALAASASFFNNFTGTGGNNSVNLQSGGLTFDSGTFGVTITNVLSGVGGLTKLGDGTLTFSGISTFTGDTMVNGGALTLADNAGLKFVIGANGVNNKVGGSGTANFLGDFTFDLSGASTTVGDSWLIVDTTALTETFGSSFTVNGFTENNDVWTFGLYQFAEANGTLSVVPEPSAMALAGLGMLLFIFNLRRNRRGAAR